MTKPRLWIGSKSDGQALTRRKGKEADRPTPDRPGTVGGERPVEPAREGQAERSRAEGAGAAGEAAYGLPPAGARTAGADKAPRAPGKAAPAGGRARSGGGAGDGRPDRSGVPFKTQVYAKWFGDGASGPDRPDGPRRGGIAPEERAIDRSVAAGDDPVRMKATSTSPTAGGSALRSAGGARDGAPEPDVDGPEGRGDRFVRRDRWTMEGPAGPARRGTFVPFRPARRPRARLRGAAGAVLSVVSALVLGGLFGYALLWFVFGDGGPVARSPSTGPEASSDVRSVERPERSGLPGAEAADGFLPKLVFYAVQGGVFRDRAGAAPLIETAKTRSIPAAVVEGDPLRVFFGVAYREDDAMKLAAYYAGKGVDVYVRPYDLTGGAITEAVPGDVRKLIGSFLTHGLYLFDLSGRWTAEGLSTPVEIGDPAWQAFRDTHGRFLDEGSRLKAHLPPPASADVEAMTQALNAAVMGLVEYLKAPSDAYLLANEEARLRYFQALRSLYDHLRAR
ncbi:MAG: hypothetical protein IMX05_02215 [Hydrogenibacillus schlegelii]|nr:hypothetical protein [Hydrogenibacillus schlegelii]